MNLADMTNGSLELVGGLMQCANVRRLLKDKMVRGVSWPFTAFFAGWGIWNCYYYPSLGQWFSFAGGTVIVAANVIWVALAICYCRA
jgi:hypothetical protein